jgi:uncharacterized protein YcbK (DUF882 family)
MKALFSKSCVSRLLCAVVLLGGILWSSSWTATLADSPEREYRLRLFQTHTNERIDVVYRRGDAYLSGALAQLDYFLRDRRTGGVRHFDPRLYDLLENLAASVGHPGAEIDVICGYRTRWSNGFLRAHTSGVAENSLHVQAEAIDIRIPGVDTYQLREAALALHRGGVGYYPHSDFVHVDLGRIRQWCLDCATEPRAAD